MESNARETDRLRVQLLLRVGLFVAVSLMISGLVAKCLSSDWKSSGVGMLEIFGGVPLSLPDRLMAAGVLALALTPAFRVLALVILWIRERDWRFVGVAVTVLVVLLIAMRMGA